MGGVLNNGGLIYPVVVLTATKKPPRKRSEQIMADQTHTAAFHTLLGHVTPCIHAR